MGSTQLGREAELKLLAVAAGVGRGSRTLETDTWFSDVEEEALEVDFAWLDIVIVFRLGYPPLDLQPISSSA